MCRCHVSDATAKPAGRAVPVKPVWFLRRTHPLGRYPPGHDRSRAQGAPAPERHLALAAPPVSTALAALLAGLLGLPAGMVARALARRHCRRAMLARPPLTELATALLWALLALRIWPFHPAALPTYPALVLVAVLLLVASLIEHDLGRMPRALEAGALAGGVLLALASPGGMGL